MCLRHKQYDWYSSDTSILGVGPFSQTFKLRSEYFRFKPSCADIQRSFFTALAAIKLLFYIENQSKRTDYVSNRMRNMLCYILR